MRFPLSRCLGIGFPGPAGDLLATGGREPRRRDGRDLTVVGDGPTGRRQGRLEMSRTFRAGLAVFGLLSLGDLAAPLLTDGEHPPMSIALIASALGLVSLVLVIAAWRGARRAVVPLIVLRVVSALSAVPAFFAGDVPAAAMVAAALVVVLTALGTALLLVPAPQLAGAR